MLTLENNGRAHLVKVHRSDDYPEFKGARAIAQIVNNRLYIVGECVDGVTRMYHSTTLVGSLPYGDGKTRGTWYRTHTGKVWVLA